jgi:UPF0271 protein
MRTPGSIDLNADVGEGCGHDAELIALVSSVNIACGAHAGDLGAMRRTIELALSYAAAIGAHPGFADRAHFGRREQPVTPAEAARLVTEQTRLLELVALEFGARVSHVKLHGALYNMVSRDAALADGVAGAVAALRADPPILVALAGSALAEAGLRRGLEVSREAFADRAYAPDGSLAPRSLPGAVIREPELAAEQAVRLARDGFVRAYDGREVRVEADTLCVHGDSPGAVAMARLIRERLGLAGIAVRR